jgi:hypothetical protein
MLDAPAKAAWPPLVTAKGQFVSRARRIRIEISLGELGMKMQVGFGSVCCLDQ